DIAAAHGVSEDDIVERRFSEKYVALMKDLIARSRRLFAEGMPLSKMVDQRLSIDLEMFSRGGLAVLDAIEAQGFDTLHQRPSIGKGKQAGLLGRTLLAHLAAKVLPAGPSERVPQATDTMLPFGPDEKVETARSYEACHDIARSARSNFYYAFYLLPKPKRDALAALYAFMRLVDDVADEGEDLATKQRGLARWRTELDHAVTGLDRRFDGNAALPLLEAAPSGAKQVLPALVDTIQ